MGVLGRILRRRRADRRVGVLAEDRPAEQAIEAPRPTPTQARFERPRLTPSLESRKIGGTAGTRRYGAPAGTPSTQRLHNPHRHGR